VNTIYVSQAETNTSVVLVFVVDYGFCFYCVALAVLHYDRDALCGHPDSLLRLGPYRDETL
jgi:hypothetical protein